MSVSSPTSQDAQVPKGHLWSVVVLGLLGAITSIYSIWHHVEFKKHGGTDAICNLSSVWSCDNIAASKYSELWHIPLGVWGLGFFLSLVILAVTLLPKKPLTQKVGSHLASLILLSFVGVGTSLVLAALSFFVIESYCVTCTIVYTINFALGGVAIHGLVKGRWCLTWFSSKGSTKASDTTPWTGLSSAGIVLLAIIAGYSQLMRPNVDPKEFADHPEQNEQRRQQNSQILGSKQYEIVIHRSPYSEVGEDYRLGNDQAAITVVEFLDFECPACARVSPVTKALVGKFPQSVNVVVKNYPLDSSCNKYVAKKLHPFACKVALLARCAGAYGKFWQYHDLAFAQQQELKKGVPEKWALSVGLSDNQIAQCLASEDLAAKIKDDIEQGKKLQVEGTPAIFIGGRKYHGSRTLEAFIATIETLMRASSQPAGTPQSDQQQGSNQ